MLKFLVLSLGLLQLTVAQLDPDIEIPNLNETELEKPTYRFAPFILRNKLYSVNAVIKVNWYQAQKICSYQGMTLATINSAEEMKELHQYFIDKDYLPQNGHYWLSGTDLGSQHQWFWLSNGRPLLYNNWGRNEPNNLGGNEHCIELMPNGNWNDLNCDRPLYFICENRCELDSYSVPIYDAGK